MKTKINTEQIFTLGNVLGACTLDGVPARVEPSGNGRLARVSAENGRSILFNWSVAQRVIQLRGGRFVTVTHR